MSDLDAQFMALFKKKPVPIQVWAGVVQSVDGLTCTVKISGTELVAEGVNLRADEDAKEGILITPRVGSLVYCASLENSIDSLFVCLYSEVDAVAVAIDAMHVTVDKNSLMAQMDNRSVILDTDGVALAQDQVKVQLSSGKVSIKNGAASLKTLFTDVLSLIEQLKVLCTAPGSLSAPDPSTVARAAALKTTVQNLLA